MNSFESTLEYLASPDGLISLKHDPYWPKWDGPWWHMLLLHEMHMSSRIPRESIETLIESLNTNCLHTFPLVESELPPGTDPFSGIPCHCQLGSVYQLLFSTGVDVDQRLPWIRPWFLKYQLPDGGLNCDEQVYTRAKPNSSIVSTLPPLEAILFCTPREFSPQEIEFLDRGAEYLIRKKLFRSESSGNVLDESWTKLCFPRFYQYDILRGLTFLLRWAVDLKRPLPTSAIKETIDLIEEEFPDDRIYIRRSIWKDSLTRYRDPLTKEWTKVPAKSFPLLEAIGSPGSVSPHLSASWYTAKKHLSTLIDRASEGST